MNLEVIKEEIENIEITEDLCLSMLEKSKDFAGYGLLLAKTQVHLDSETGWEAFCKKAGIGKSTANRLVNFYGAKSAPFGADSLPDNEFTFRALVGDTVEEKAALYSKVKQLTHTEHPTALDIRVVKSVQGRHITDKKLLNDVYEYLNAASTTIRETFAKYYKQIGVKRMLNHRDLPEDDMVALLKGDPKPKKLAVPEDVQFELKMLRAENRQLKATLRGYDIFTRYREFHSMISDIARIARKTKHENKKAFTRMLPTIKKAYELLDLELLDNKPSFDEVKKAYRNMAKKLHPDIGGDAKEFANVSGAYEELKKLYENQ